MNKVVGVVINSDTENIIDCIKSDVITDINVFVKDMQGDYFEEVERTGADNIIKDNGNLNDLRDYLMNLICSYEFNSKDLPEYLVYFDNYNGIRGEEYIDKAIQRLKYDSSATSLVSITPSKENPFKTVVLNENGNLSSALNNPIKEPFTLPENRFPNTYQITNYIHIFKYTTLKRGSLYGEKIIGYQL